MDPREETLPPLGWLRVEDPETGEEVLVDSGRAVVRQGFEQRDAARRERLKSMLRGVGIDCVEVRTDRPYIEPLLRFFRMRSLRR